jgi:succinate-semialdehyde dehydrogenase/glutarate-semialdehyde dehydrogenase
MSDIKSRLKDGGLWRTDSYINGEWVKGDGRFDVNNPADRSKVADVADVGAQGAKRAVKAAAAANLAWRRTSAFERSRIVNRWYELIMEHQDDLGIILAAEMGKPLKEAKGEVAYGAGFVQWAAEEARRVHGETLAVPTPGARGWTIRQPVGVVSCITPWNFPSAMITRKCAPALAVGCPVVIKPASETPLSALALAELAERAGFPKGVFNVVTGEAREIGPVMTGSDEVAMIGFTGSTEVGALLMEQAAKGIKRVALELGGNAPFIIMDDANLEDAADGLVRGKFRAAGQTCVSPNRVFVQEGVIEELTELVRVRVAKLKMGDPFADGTDVGPLIHEEAVSRVAELVDSAAAKGAKVLVGGKSRVDDMGGAYFEPTLITGADHAMSLACNEIFGPVAALYPFKDEEDVIRLANDTPYGLAAYLYTRDAGRIHRITEGIDFGMIGVNAPMVGSPATPFGGMKQSGIGREGGKWAAEEFTELKFVLLGGVDQ